MVSAEPSVGVRHPDGTATTTTEAKAHKSTNLILSGQKLTTLPPGLSDLPSVTSLDLSNNNLGSIPEGVLPPKLVELVVTGCNLTQLPKQIAKLLNLLRLFAGANKIEDITCVFECPKLQHAGLSYNAVASLPPASVLSQSPLLSLDLSHNNLSTPLRQTLAALAKLPGLANVSLQGNSVCMLQSYSHEARTALTRLLFLDGNRVDALGGSRPATTTAMFGRGAMAGGFDSPPADTYLELSLSGLALEEDPFQAIKDRWQEQIAEAEAANATVPPVLEQPALPLQPVIYHVELTDADGTAYGSVPLKIEPPSPPDVAVLFDPKLKAAAAAAAAKAAADKGKAKPPSAKGAKPGAKGAKGAVPEADSGPRVLETGRLKVPLPLYATAPYRDWLRNGFKVTLHCTKLTAVPDLEAPEAAPATPPKGAAKPGKKGEEAPKPKFKVEAVQEVIGEALATTGAGLVSGYEPFTAEAPAPGVAFTPPKALFDDSGIRMPLKDARHPSQQVATMALKLTLHAEPPSKTSRASGSGAAAAAPPVRVSGPGKR